MKRENDANEMLCVLILLAMPSRSQRTPSAAADVDVFSLLRRGGRTLDGSQPEVRVAKSPANDLAAINRWRQNQGLPPLRTKAEAQNDPVRRQQEQQHLRNQREEGNEHIVETEEGIVNVKWLQVMHR
jgi:hypothetical protein